MDLANLKKSITEMTTSDLEVMLQQVRKGRRTFTNTGEKVKSKRKPKKPSMTMEQIVEKLDTLSDQLVQLKDLGADAEIIDQVETGIKNLITEKIKLEMQNE